MPKKFLSLLITCSLLLPISSTLAQAEFNPSHIISDAELQDTKTWTRDDVQKFLDSKASYLKNYETVDIDGAQKKAADIIYDAALRYQINPKFLLVTLQKEQSLVMDDSPTQKQLDWATGYAVCDSCSMDDPKVQKFKGFGPQVDNAAGVMRWYYENTDKGYVKKKDTPILIDNQQVVPQSWATAFLYTYTPHLNGNKNFWRIWDTWFSQLYPNGTLVQAASSTEVWLIQDVKKRHFANKSALITRADPKMIITIPDIQLDNYENGAEITLPNYSILRTPQAIYLLDYDTLRPFESEEVVKKLGFNPQEIVDISSQELAGYATGPVITANSAPPQGIIYEVTDLKNTFFVVKNDTLQPVLDKRVIEVNYANLPVKKITQKDFGKGALANFTLAYTPATFKDGTLLQIKGGSTVYVIENGKKRKIADEETFNSFGYKRSNVVTIDLITSLNILEGEPLFVNNSLLSAQNKFLGDSEAEIKDLFGTKLNRYIVAEYPSGRIISGKNIDSPAPMASLTKLLTAYEAINEDFKGTTVMSYNEKKYGAYSNSLKFKDGQRAKANDLLNIMLVGSVNNTARMVAQSTGKTESEFLHAISERLQEWGADNTTLSDVTGLSANNISSPRDLLKIFVKTTNNPTLKPILGKTKYDFQTTLGKKTIKQNVSNTNPLLGATNKTYKVIASKTGYIDEGGANLAMLIESKNDKKQYVIITMGDTDYTNRFVEPDKIANWIATSDVASLIAKK
jgi:D-alanyl-D-alanine endopeptidase (penicillin-binding protein 7)